MRKLSRAVVASACGCLLVGCGGGGGRAGPVAPGDAPPSGPPTAASSPSAPLSSGPASASPRSSKSAPVIVIDPGHSGRSIRSTDPSTGLTDFDYPNAPEMDEVYEVSACVASGLRDLGYRVVMTKKSADDTVGLAERARIADKAHADLAISVHNDHGQGPEFQAVYSQRGVKHDGSYGPMWRGSGSNRTRFDHPAVARASARYARDIAHERGKVLGTEVAVTEENFSGRSGLEPGNLALVQLLADVPWVYNEMGALTDGSTTHRMTRAAQADYAEGLLKGVVAAVPGPATDEEPASHAELAACIGKQH